MSTVQEISEESRSNDLETKLLDNSLDFLLSAAEAVCREEGPRSLKDSVLHLASGIELLLKARLVREHWSLIFSDINKADFRLLAEADFASVDPATAEKRLKQIVGITLDKTAKAHVTNLRERRNKLTHFTVTLDPEQTRSLVLKGINLAIAFCEQEGMTILDSQGKVGAININLVKIQEYVQERMEAISKDREESFDWECPDCWQQALVFDGAFAECKYCLHLIPAEYLASNHSEGPGQECPECGKERTFAFLLHNNDEGEWLCFACGTSGSNYHHCMRCGQMEYFQEAEELKICNSCWSDMTTRG